MGGTVPDRSPRRAALPWALAGGAVVFALGLAIAYGGSLLLSLAVGVLVLAGLLWIGWRRTAAGTDVSRRTFLRGAGVAGLGLVAGGAGVGRVVQRATKPDPKPVVEAMARNVGSEVLTYLQRGYFPGRSGDLQLVLAPFNTSNYSFESLELTRKDPRSSHAMAWGYTERIPLVVHSPGLVPAGSRTERVTLADLAPSTAQLIGFRGFQAKDGRPLPGLPAEPATKPKLVVTFVIDGGGWNVLNQWPTAWPNLRRLMREGLSFRNAVMGSFPSVTACAHATIGTGSFPSHHGISGHNVRRDPGSAHSVKAYGEAGSADPGFIAIPTLAEEWSDETGNRAWVGEIGYQIWHLGMLGRGGRFGNRLPVAIYYDEDVRKEWRPQNPDLYRLPNGIPEEATLETYMKEYFGPVRGADLFRAAGRKACCSPPIVRFESDVIATTVDSEELGRHASTDLLYVNYKMPDYTGHVYNMLSIQEKIALQQVDHELGRLAGILESRFQPGEAVLIVTADHGQCPLVDVAGGVRLDPIQLAEDINNAFGRSVFPLLTADDVKPSEVYLDSRALSDGGATRDDIAAFLADYRYGDNVGPYISNDVVAHERRDDPEFAGVFSTDFLGSLDDAAIARLGPGNFAHADIGMPEPP
jgi:Type I phosphodiesterase / nucleotide pyrophosphatase